MKSRWFLCALLLLSTIRFAAAQNQVLDLDGKGSYPQISEFGFQKLCGMCGAQSFFDGLKMAAFCGRSKGWALTAGVDV